MIIMSIIGHKIPWRLTKSYYWARSHALLHRTSEAHIRPFAGMITCAVRRYGLLLRTPPHDICRPYLATSYRPYLVRRTLVLRILSVSHDVQTLDQLNCDKPEVSLPAEFGGLDVPSVKLDVELNHYALYSMRPSLANLIIVYEIKSLGPMYGFIRHERLLHIAIYALPWAVQLCHSYDTISNIGGFSELDLAVFTIS
jgi:hypothetical protein